MLAGIPGVAIYLDDIVVHRANTRVHDERLTMVLAALTKHKLTLNSEKCVFPALPVEFVGFHLSAHGVTPLQSNVDTIQAIPEPSSAAEMAFLGMAGYYLKFLPHYSEAAAPLRELLCKDMPWVWSPACRDAAHSLKA